MVVGMIYANCQDTCSLSWHIYRNCIYFTLHRGVRSEIFNKWKKIVQFSPSFVIGQSLSILLVGHGGPGC